MPSRMFLPSSLAGAAKGGGLAEQDALAENAGFFCAEVRYRHGDQRDGAQGASHPSLRLIMVRWFLSFSRL